MGKLHARPMERRDVEESIPIARYMHSCSPVYAELSFVDAVMRTGFLKAIENPDYWFCQVIEHEGKIVGGMLGCASYEAYSDRRIAYERGIFVIEELRGSRAAVMLIRAFEAWAKAAGCVKVSVAVSAGIDNPRAERLYKGTGFKEVGKILHKDIT